MASLEIESILVEHCPHLVKVFFFFIDKANTVKEAFLSSYGFIYE